MAEKRVVAAFDDVDEAEQAAEGAPGSAAVDDHADDDTAFGRDRGDSAERPPDTTVAVEVEDPAETAAVAKDLDDEGAETVEVDPAAPTGTDDADDFPKPDEA
jgi:hypothetical protein